MNERYKIIEGSQTGHCCFEYTVVDTLSIKSRGETEADIRYAEVCECFDRPSAVLICNALNASVS